MSLITSVFLLQWEQKIWHFYYKLIFRFISWEILTHIWIKSIKTFNVCVLKSASFWIFHFHHGRRKPLNSPICKDWWDYWRLYSLGRRIIQRTVNVIFIGSFMVLSFLQMRTKTTSRTNHPNQKWRRWKRKMPSTPRSTSYSFWLSFNSRVL